MSDATPRVLIIEDDPKLRAVLVEMAGAAGFAADAVATAETALRRARAEDWPVLLVDINLPQMDGLELLRRVTDLPGPARQCVILTGFGSLDAAQQAIRLGASDFLTKPCRLAELEQALARAWRRYDARQSGLDRRLAPGPPDADDAASPQPLAEVERQHILAALQRHAGNRRAAAAELGISLRKLYYRLKAYGEDT